MEPHHGLWGMEVGWVQWACRLSFPEVKSHTLLCGSFSEAALKLLESFCLLGGVLSFLRKSWIHMLQLKIPVLQLKDFACSI